MSCEIAESVETFLRARFHVPADDDRFDDRAHLFEQGYVDSAGVVELIAHLERSFGIRLPDDVLFSERFTTIEGIAETVRQLKRGSC